MRWIAIGLLWAGLVTAGHAAEEETPIIRNATGSTTLYTVPAGTRRFHVVSAWVNCYNAEAGAANTQACNCKVHSSTVAGGGLNDSTGGAELRLVDAWVPGLGAAAGTLTPTVTSLAVGPINVPLAAGGVLTCTLAGQGGAGANCHASCGIIGYLR